jgi:enoyl-[acyl-carrier protein] reductase II
MPVVSSIALAVRLERSGADVIVAEGMESGGHVGETTTMALVPQVVDAVRIPVVAAGGIGDGRGLAAALALGAQGVQMGTRFVCSQECIAHAEYKRKVVDAKDRSTTVTGKSTGHPVRCIQNRMTRRLHELEKSGASVEEIMKLAGGSFPLGIIEGDVENGSLMAGQIAGLMKDIKPVKAIIEDMVSRAEEILSGLATLNPPACR